MSSDWYDKYHRMRADIFGGTPDAVQSAREFYQSIVDSPAIVRLTVALRLQVTDGGQDWEIEVADADRVAEFLDYYENAPLDEEERYYLLELIVASFEAYLQSRGQDERLAARVRRHLVESFEAHRDTVAYWAALQEPEPTRFAISSVMREIWESG